MKARIPDKTQAALTCPNCGPSTALVVRTNQRTKGQFLGCPNYDDPLVNCKYTQSIPEDVRLRLEAWPDFWAGDTNGDQPFSAENRKEIT